MKKILLITFLLVCSVSFSQKDPNILVGLNSPAYGVKIKANWPNVNSGWARGFHIVNEDNTKNFISFGVFGGTKNGKSSLEYGWIGQNWGRPFMTFLPNGNVGIGTKNPNQALVVDGSIGFDYNKRGSFNGVKRSGVATEYYNTVTKTNTNVIHKFTGGAGKLIMSMTQGGNIGIGTNNPRGKLEVYFGNDSSNREIYFTSQQNGANQNSNSPRLNFVGAYQKAGFGIQALNVGGYGKKDLVFYAHNSKDYNTYYETVRFKYNGNVGIGTSKPSSKLSVNGNIHTREVKVDLKGWADFVFDRDYKLPTLKEVENHINEKGHLKDIPSAKEVLEKGLKLGEMNKKLLQKIEELTLYTIQQQKEINLQKDKLSKLDILEKKNSNLEKRLKDLELLLVTLKK